MVGTIIDYVTKYGDYSFTEKPFNVVDNLVFCQFSYLKFDGIVPSITENKKSVTVKKLKEHADFDKLFADVRFEKENRALFEAIMKSRRFQNIKLNCYINIIETEWETQFSAVTFILDNNELYIAYRGTDETIIGWKEDFNMAFQTPVPGQEYAVKYLNMVTGRLQNNFYLGGHSKGGNEAIYAAMNCTSCVKKRIIKVFSMDGPGFRQDVLNRYHYEEIKDKVVKILPHSSLVGMLFEKSDHYKVVESNAFGLLQHDSFTWLIEEDDFVYVKGLYNSRKFKDDTLNEWVASLNDEQMKIFVDTLYKVIAASQKDNLIDFSADWMKSMNAVMNAIKELDEPTKKAIKQIVKALVDITVKRMTNQNKPKKKVNRTDLSGQ